MTQNPDFPNETHSGTSASLDRATMRVVAEEMLPLHEVDQYVASIRDLIEFRVSDNP